MPSSYLTELLKKCRNKLFCNISQFAEFQKQNNVPHIKVVGSLWVPVDTVYIVDNEGRLEVVRLSDLAMTELEADFEGFSGYEEPEEDFE